MNENLDLTKILEGCPKGTKFYSTTYGTVEFIGFDFSSVYPIVMKLESSGVGYFTKDGRIFHSYYGECTLFPSKDQRDWSKFERFWDKPKIERFDLKTLQPLDKVLVRDINTEEWHLDLFSNITHFGECACVGGCWNMAIPYNDNTKHLLGIRNNCDECYVWWEE